MQCAREISRGCSILLCTLLVPLTGRAQTVDDPALRVSTYLSGLSQPTGMRFFAPNEGFMIEKGTGQVKLFDAGKLSTVLDLNVQGDSERGLLGLALDPSFKTNHSVYLYYSATSASGDSTNTSDWAGNRIAKYQWNGSTLVSTGISRTISSPSDRFSSGPNHDGGPILFGPDGKLYGVTGDLNRDGPEQNNKAASASAKVGGVYRLNTDLTPAADNPFHGSFAQWYAYGVRNSFGLAFDPVTHKLWDTENGTNDYDEINQVKKGANGGWNRIQGPASRSPTGALGDLHMLPGAFYEDPKLSFLSVIAPTAIQFLDGSNWGPGYNNAVIIGDNNTHRLYLLRLNADRSGFQLTGGLSDLVADTDAQTNSLVFGHDFGTVTDLEVGADGALYVTSLTDGKVYRIGAVVPEAEAWVIVTVGFGLLVTLARRRRRALVGIA